MTVHDLKAALLTEVGTPTTTPGNRGTSIGQQAFAPTSSISSSRLECTTG